MAFQRWNNNGTLWVPLPSIVPTGNIGGGTMDAVGESQFAIGRVMLSTGVGTSKTLQDGDKIHFRVNTVVWAGTTTIRIGVQDVGSTGLNDDSWTSEPYGELVRGTDPLTSNSVTVVTLSSGGSRVITHGDLLAIGIEMTVRGGSDSVIMSINPAGFPHGASDTGAGPVKNSSCPLIVIEFADDTVGYLGLDSLPYNLETSANLASNTTPDELGVAFYVPTPIEICSLYARLSSLNATDDFEIIVYSDPFGGTPVVEEKFIVDADLIGLSTHNEFPLASVVSLLGGTDYVIAIRPTTTNPLQVQRLNLGSGGENIRKALPFFGSVAYQVTRTDNTGPFGSPDTTLVPQLGFRQIGFEDGTGAPASGGGPLLGGRLIQ